MKKIFSIDKYGNLIINNTLTTPKDGNVITIYKNNLGVNIIEDNSISNIALDKHGNLKVKSIISNSTSDGILYKFGLLSDAHIDGDGTDTAYSISDLKNAIQYFNNKNCKFIVHCGDVTENGRSEDYSALKSCLATSNIPNYSVRGNHDMTNGYSEATGCADDYTITQNNDLFIFLSPSATSGTLSDEKLNWLENLLATNTDKRIFFIYHFFFNNTAGNACNLDNGGLPSNNASVIRLKAMIESYSNLIFCNGHSHLRFSLQDLDPNANYYHEEGKCYYVHVPSTSRPRGDNGSGGTTNIYGGSEGYLVEVYANKVIFKPIDFIGNQYLSKYNYTVNVPQGNNAPTIPIEPPESSSEVITPTWMNGDISSSSGADITDAEGMRSSYMEFDTNAYTYYITVTNEFEGIDKLRVAIYNPDGSFVVRQSYTSTSLTPGVPGAITFPVTSGKFRLKVDFKLTNTLENINSRLVITKVPKEPSESIPGQIIFNWETGSIDGSTGLDESMSSAMRTNYVEFDTNSYNYYITVTDEYDVNCSTKIYFYNPDGSFKSRKSYSPTSLVVGETKSIPFPITTGTFRVRTNYGKTNTAENINSRIIITREPK